MSEIDFDDFFEPEEGEAADDFATETWAHGSLIEKFSENEEDFDFIDPAILQQFERASISIEKIQKEIFNFDEKGEVGGWFCFGDRRFRGEYLQVSSNFNF